MIDRPFANVRRFAIAAAAALVAGLGGCNSGPEDKAEAIRDDLTPEMETLYQRPDDVDNQWTMTKNENWRMFRQDLNRAFYLDRPSRLTREPVPRP